MAKGRLQVSTDGKAFADVAEFNRGVAEVKDSPMWVKSIRLIADEAVDRGLRVREVYLYR